jgi:transposase
MQLGGVGPTTGTCLLAMIGNGHDFDCGRQFAAWLGLTPRQYSSGGKTRLGRITKAGDAYLRSLLVLGAKSAVMTAHKRSDKISQWLVQLLARVGWQKAVVALANKNARIVWALLAKGREFDPNYVSVKPGEVAPIPAMMPA